MQATCPACGYVLIPHRARVDCKRCGRRIPVDVEKCPRCGKNPRTGGRSIAKYAAIVIISGLLLGCIGWIVFRTATVALIAKPTPIPPTPYPTVIHIIQVIASPTPLPPTLTPISARGTVAPANTTYAAITLGAPPDRTIFAGGDAEIFLQWQGVSATGLRDNEWYEIQLTFTNRTGTLDDRRSVSKDTQWRVPVEFYRDISPAERTLNWNVRVVRASNANPLVGTRTPINAPSVTRAFIWQ